MRKKIYRITINEFEFQDLKDFANNKITIHKKDCDIILRLEVL